MSFIWFGVAQNCLVFGPRFLIKIKQIMGSKVPQSPKIVIFGITSSAKVPPDTKNIMIKLALWLDFTDCCGLVHPPPTYFHWVQRVNETRKF